MPTKKTKKEKDLESQVKSLEKEIKSLNSSTKVLARDVDNVTKTLKNSKKIAKAAKTATEKVSDKDVERISESIAREKQLVKLVDKMTGTLKQSDVNKITKALTFGKELGKLARSISSRITAREVNALNKALVNAKEVKRISNSLADKISKVDIKVLTGAAKYKKDAVANEKAAQIASASPDVVASSAATNTLEAILNSVSVLPKIAEDVSKLISERKVDAKQKIIKRSEELEALREGGSKSTTATKNGSMTTPAMGAASSASAAGGGFSLASGAAGLSAAALAAVLASPELRNTILDAGKKAAGEYVEKKKEGAKSWFGEFGQNLLSGDFNLAAKQIKDVASPTMAGFTTLAKTISAPGKAISNSLSKAGTLGKLFGFLSPTLNANRLLGVAGKFATPLNLAAGVADVVQGATSDAYLKYGTGRFTTGLATGMAGQEDEPTFWRVLSKMGLGATAGGLGGSVVPGIGTTVGAVGGAITGGLAAYYGPEKTAKVIDGAMQYGQNVATSIYEDVTSGFMATVGDGATKAYLKTKELGLGFGLSLMNAQKGIRSFFGTDTDSQDLNKSISETKALLEKTQAEREAITANRIKSMQNIEAAQNRRWSQSTESWREETYGRKPINTAAGGMSDYIQQLFKVESSNNPNAKNPLSSASGLGQFTKGTWERVTKQMGKNWTLADRFDPQKMLEATTFLTNQNRNILKTQLNREPTYAELYMAHFMGPGKAARFLKMKETTPFRDAAMLFPSEAAANPSIFAPGRSLKQVFDIMSNKIEPGGTRKYLPEMSEPQIKPGQLETNPNNTVVNIINSFNQSKTDNSTRMTPAQQLPAGSQLHFGPGSPVDRGPRY
jgi:hypothetical protein